MLHIKLCRSMRYHLATTFLPAGYPHSVGPGYLPFVFWQTIHHMASAANGGAEGRERGRKIDR